MSLTTLHLQPSSLEHLPQIVELDRICLGGIWTIDGYKRELESPNSCLLSLSVPINPKYDKIIGCGCFWAILEEAHITLISIHPDYQGRGNGQLLLYALLKDAVERQLERATLEVRVSNDVALSLYQKFGFSVAGRRKGYYHQTGEDALILWRGDLHKAEFKEQLLVWEQEICDRLLREQFVLSQFIKINP
ncbi:ribosomal-protein-alanine N-acetyltransferase [Aphanothece hegewaldii CCALA 016]|uniref:Ribosomal-protein-alanine N-acetyltransferase n=1 Tax=Aphanothece hegewaldii CCALA 016 TaxID=2107694 RepID=A0A2T1M2G9_9CHRO|nr:ribosomal protein S18-alanine N-acetyltransferase [Aphanothece hegewaldii]PSF38943.1 ribosomal-protein-alanine N-acetyltransferase [Aphanothece hegewaldii CCALA 016]